MKRLWLAILIVLASASWAQAQQLCTRVNSTTQTCTVTLTWTGSVVDATHSAPTNYLIQRGDAGAAMAQIGSVVAQTVTFQNVFNDSGNVAHCWVVLATITGDGTSLPSNQACWTTPPIQSVPPNVPQGLTLSAISSKTIRISWADTNDPPANESAIQIQGKRATGQPYALIATVNPDQTTYDWVNLLSYKTYCARVRAMSGTLASAYTPASCATTSK